MKMTISENRFNQIQDTKHTGDYDVWAAGELEIFINNNVEAYNAITPICENLRKHENAGVFDELKAAGAFCRIGELGAKLYVKTFGGGKWFEIFPVTERTIAGMRVYQEYIDTYFTA